MFGQLNEFVLSRIIGVMVHRREILTEGERAAREAFTAKLKIEKRKTGKPFIVAFIGLVGSGKSSVARELAKHIGATVVGGDDIRIELRKRSENYERARAVAEDAALEIVRRGGNAVLDSDFVDRKKRASLREKARKVDVPVVFICTYADYDIMIGRALTADYYNHCNDFFGGAGTAWQGGEQTKGAVVKIREMLRRTPLHYKWKNELGGRWVIKNPPCVVIADIDTTDSSEWKREVKKCAEQLLSR